MDAIESALAGLSSVNEEKLSSLKEILGDAMEEIIMVYKDDARDRIAEIRSSIGSGDIETWYRLCHSLKSASGNIALDRMYEIALQMELMGRESKVNGIEHWLDALEKEFEKVSAII